MVEPSRPAVHPAAMKRLTLIGLFLACAAVALAEDEFLAQLTPEERAATGVDQLTPAQRAAIDRLAGRHAREAAGRATEVGKIEAKQATARARAEGEVVAQAKLDQEIRKRDEARLGLAGPQEGKVAVRSRIAGPIKGWSGRTLFRLENGQTWVQADTSDSYWVPAQESPEVEVRPSGMGGWKLYLLSNELWVRVKRVN